MTTSPDLKTIKIIATKKLPEPVEERLRSLFDFHPNLDDHDFDNTEFQNALKHTDGILCTITNKIDHEALSVSDKRATILSNFGVGVSNIDLEAASKAGLTVTNTPDVLTDATADIAILLMLAATRKAYAAEKMLREKRWKGFAINEGLGTGLQGKTLGIIGMGRIGQAVARRAIFGFGMKVIYFNRSKKSDIDFECSACASIEEVMTKSDVISLNMPGSGGAPIITADHIASMSPDAYLVNTARGDVIDEAALVDALVNQKIAGAGLDVFAKEPQVPEALLSLENVTLYPHIGSATIETRTAMGMLAVDNLVAHFTDQNYPSRVI